MGREIKRVPLDFDAPLDKEWAGYHNPHFKPCPESNRTCFGGDTGAAKWLWSVCRMLALLGDEALAEPHGDELRARGRSYPHPYLVEFPQAPHKDIPSDDDAKIRAIEDSDQRMAAVGRYLREHPLPLVPFGEETIALIEGLSKRERKTFGLGAGVDYAIYKRLLKVAGLPVGWGRCPVCNGEGVDPAAREAYDGWERVEPPKGDGWQLWQTVSDGPLSPVFATADELIEWMCQPVPVEKRRRCDPKPYPDSPWGQGWRREIAEPFVKKHGWSPSAITVGDRFFDGPAGVVELSRVK